MATTIVALTWRFLRARGDQVWFYNCVHPGRHGGFLRGRVPVTVGEQQAASSLFGVGAKLFFVHSEVQNRDLAGLAGPVFHSAQEAFYPSRPGGRTFRGVFERFVRTNAGEVRRIVRVYQWGVTRSHSERRGVRRVSRFW